MELARVAYKDSQFSINALSPQRGAFILNQLIDKLVDVAQKADDESDNTDVGRTPSPEVIISAMLRKLDEKTFGKVQQYCLECVHRLEDVGGQLQPMPIITPSGVITISELQFDIKCMSFLTSQVLNANMSPFFTKDELRKIVTGTN